MSRVRVSSNVSKASVDAVAALRALSKAASEALGKPEQYVMALLDLDVPMLFQGSDAVRAPYLPPYASCIGKASAGDNPATAKALTDTVARVLHVPAERVFMNLDGVARHNWARGGAVF